MHVERFPDAASFLQAAEPYLLRSEVENALILGIAHGVVNGTVTPEITPYFAVVREGTDLFGAAFQTVPAKVGLTRIHSDETIAILAQDIDLACPGFDTLVGPEPTVGKLAARMAVLRGGRTRRTMAQRIHQLRAVKQLALSPGRLRPALPGDVSLLTDWAADFLQIAGDDSNPAEAVQTRLAKAQLYVWYHEAPVSMAAAMGKTPNGIRVGFVYTPPARRGRGYATAAVATLSRLLLDQGNRFCCLYTDLANPTSNAIYYRIGYRPVCDAAVYSLSAITPA